MMQCFRFFKRSQKFIFYVKSSGSLVRATNSKHFKSTVTTPESRSMHPSPSVRGTWSVPCSTPLVYRWGKWPPEWTCDFPTGKCRARSRKNACCLPPASLFLPQMRRKLMAEAWVKVSRPKSGLQRAQNRIDLPSYYFTLSGLWTECVRQCAITRSINRVALRQNICVPNWFSPHLEHTTATWLCSMKGGASVFPLGEGTGAVISPRQARLAQQEKIKYRTYIHITLPLTSVGAALAGMTRSAVEERLEWGSKAQVIGYD